MFFNSFIYWFLSTGLPIGVTFSFLISSPLVDLASIIVLASVFNWKIAIAYVFLALILAVVGGIFISYLKLEDQIEPFVFNSPIYNGALTILDIKAHFLFAKEQVLDIIKKVWQYILIGVGIGAMIHN